MNMKRSQDEYERVVLKSVLFRVSAVLHVRTLFRAISLFNPMRTGRDQIELIKPQSCFPGNVREHA
jgi:hypothetical protein